MTNSTKRWLQAAWLVLIATLVALHFVHLRADFPNHSPWMDDWAKYTDEGWYGNAAVRAEPRGELPDGRTGAGISGLPPEGVRRWQRL